MNIRYQHANPFSGRESVLLRLSGVFEDQTVCLLIDAGKGVSVDELLDDDEYLTAICLTHAHYDHYQSLADNLQDGAAVYMTAETETLLSAAYERVPDTDQTETSDVRSKTTVIDGWTTIVEGVRVRPLPAGHAPGASSLLFAIDDGDTQRTILATGDFTLRRAAGYPGFEPDLPIPVDVCLLSATANESFPSDLTGVLEQAIERAVSGSRVLVTASGQTGLQLGYLLNSVLDEQGYGLEITLAGQPAIIADRLGYQLSHCECLSEFAPDELLDPGTITIASPGTPRVNRSTGAAQLFERIRTDPGATLLQLPTEGQPVEQAACTVHTTSLQNHPSRETIDEVVQTLQPVHLVVLHETGSQADRYKDKYRSYVWVTADQLEHTLLDAGGWTPPEWVSDHTAEMVRNWTIANRHSTGQITDIDPTAFPSVDREPTPALALEGVAVDQLPAKKQQSDSDAGKYPVAGPVETPTTESHQEDDLADTIASLTERIDSLEATVSEQTTVEHGYSGRVIDTADGVTIVRIDAQLPGLAAGDRVTVIPPEQ